MGFWRTLGEAPRTGGSSTSCLVALPVWTLTGETGAGTTAAALSSLLISVTTVPSFPVFCTWVECARAAPDHGFPSGKSLV